MAYLEPVTQGMGVALTAPMPVRPPDPDHAAEALAVALLADGHLTAPGMVDILMLHARRKGRLADLLVGGGHVAEPALYDTMSRVWQAPCLPAAELRADPRLIEQLGPVTCLEDKLVPLQRLGGTTLVCTARPEDFHHHLPRLEHLFGPVAMALAPPAAVEGAVLAASGAGLAQAAETCVAAQESCRSYRAENMRLPVGAGLAILVTAAVLWPGQVCLALALIALTATLGFTGLKIAAAVATLTQPLRPLHNPPRMARLPVVSIMVALYRESDIAVRLVQRLGRLDYPQDLLDVLLVVEAEDHLTRGALAQANLPPWMRMVLVPPGSVKTKPRALNFALDHCRGTLVGVYDAEDAPEPDQIRKVVDRFHQRGPQVACLQGRLDFYTPRVNWLSRCFTIEYAAWFRLLLPGIARLGLAVPLGGTTLFFRRDVLDRLGRWDAHNVTEDADLGMRLARHGYRTEVIDTTTFEEANCRALPWVKQRSRWIKGFMMTWLTHMRRPRQLWRDLGPRQFAGFQLLLAGSVIHALLAPVLWSFWLVPLGVAHPAASALGPAAFGVMWKVFLAVEVLTITFGVLGNAQTRHGLSPLWVPTLMFYYPLATFAAWKAAWEMLTQPFYWDKTAHGHVDQWAA